MLYMWRVYLFLATGDSGEPALYCREGVTLDAIKYEEDVHTIYTVSTYTDVEQG